ncbi:hypothetical protein JOC95_001532 [Bacillus tianshenii]|uniref:DUF3298 domain-containing protein n=1 Tax=Sutcliffiella tianshenii TaxID=1463404 RepID=A0ABS2NYG3_9BACI|nr:hypothetical protein [Bacillus tianshenii]MBM7619680.1 hypothetical protein [Bacillus tianshenii]
MQNDKDLFDLIRETYPQNPRDEFVVSTAKKLRESARKMDKRGPIKRFAFASSGWVVTKLIPSVALLITLSIGAYSYFNSQNTTNSSQQNPSSNSGVAIPAIELPEHGSAKMMPLIVYKGKIYTQSPTTIDNNKVSEIKGEKLGKTKAGIDEWSNQDNYAKEFASTIGETDVYSVKGYKDGLRIMTYYEIDGEGYAEFYESLTGITVNDGNDIFGDLHLVNNVQEAKSRSYEDSLSNTNNYMNINNLRVVNAFLEELNMTKPYLIQDVEAEIGDFRNNDQYKELTLHLNDGTAVTLGVIKGGYISYGQSLYFKMNDQVFEELWNL